MSIGKSLLTLIGGTICAGLLGAVALAPAAGMTGFAAARTQATMESNLADLTEGMTPGVTTITDVHGEPLAWLYDQRRYEVPSEAISTNMKEAIVSIEDRRFYEHEGVDIQGTMRALITNILSGGVEQGASTLNQQYVKNYLLLVAATDKKEQAAATERSVSRKLREMRMASDLDKLLSKDQILTRYLNLVPFGHGAFGIEAAAKTYFGISAAELTVPQAAMLAGMVQSSSYLDPYSNEEGVLNRRNLVLETMVSRGVITQAEATQYASEPLGVLPEPLGLPNGCITAGDNGFMCDYALNYLESKGLSREDIKNGAFTIETTLDPEIQQAAHEVIAAHVSPTAPGVAEVLNIVEPGEESRNILAMTSSRSYGLELEQGQTVLPQPASLVGNGAGSVFKIFTAAVALKEGLGLDSQLEVPTRIELKGMGDGGAKNCPPDTYCVENAGVYPPKLSLRDALAQSPNTSFVNLIQEVGVSPVVDMAVALGLRSYSAPGTFNEQSSIADYVKDHNLGSFTLGPTPVNALELSNVGATLASGGRWCEPNPISKVTDRFGNEVFIDRPACEDVLDKEIAAALMQGMSTDATVGTAAAAAKSTNWTKPVAVKTGTTESHQSSAFIGFNSGFAAAPYIYNDGTTVTSLCTSPVRQCEEGSLFGGNEPAHSWFQLANRIPAATAGEIPQLKPDYSRGTTHSFLQSLVGKKREDAMKILQEHRYSVYTRIVRGNGLPKGQVVRATSEDPLLNEGSQITLEISDGSAAPLPTTIAPPVVTNRPEAPLPEITINTDELNALLDRLQAN
ncbi:transglycosylase domain-containing protein [Corynebacterium caspium]|uniref:transglycosylase domain-containing protein n=1 Tax=Corynebacterium caspium TaxID=234828 RepID=UPI0003808358|nr:transglycosylase domain-containing protein [Corynebacterium caspium]WKD58560.1 Penicillin-binding protein 2D [Corynebacterium caspium DSM 44850]